MFKVEGAHFEPICCFFILLFFSQKRSTLLEPKQQEQAVNVPQDLSVNLIISF